MTTPNFIYQYLENISDISLHIDCEAIERIVDGLVELRLRGGRLFLLGVGGGAANCSHAVNDFRKLNIIQAYTPTDNVAELTARTNDEGWNATFKSWLRVSQVSKKDIVFILSVGGGNGEANVSVNIVEALYQSYVDKVTVYGIVGRDGGYTKLVAKEVIIIPTVDPSLVTAFTESFQAIILHCIVFHPKLLVNSGKWESIDDRS